MALLTLEENGQFVTAETGPITKVTIYDYDYSQFAIGYAKLDLTDEYDEQFGIDLAYSRAMQRLNRKIEKKLIRVANG